jgi:subtilase family serine protease
MSLCVLFYSGRRLPVMLLAFAAMLSPLTALGAETQTSVIAGNHSPTVEKFVTAAAAPSGEMLTMRIDLNPAHRQELERLLAEQQEPGSPNYHRWLKTGEFDRRFGPEPAVRAAIARWLASQGFEVSKLPEGRAIKFTGTVAQAERAFSVAIYSVDGGKHYGNMSDPAVPAQFASSISFIDGLDNLRGSNSTMHIAPGSPADTRTSSQPNVKLNGQKGFGPSDFYTFYDVNPILTKGVTGTGGGCIGLIEVSDYSPTGIVNFDSAFSLATAAITTVVSPDSDNPGVNDREDESMLDIEYAHTFAPGAAISFYLTDPATYSGDLIEATVDSLNTAVNQNACSALSISIESCGFPSTYFTGPLHTTYMEAEMQHQTVYVAEGDQGSAEYDVDPSTGQCVIGTSQNVNELASDPYVTAIGGTQFTPNYNSSGDDVGFVAESVWNEPQFLTEGLGAGGGGASVVWVGQKPTFQDIGTPADNTRDVPDISMEAACQTPGAFSVFPDQSSGNNVVCCVCGTSLGAPVWAGITELMIQSNGNNRIGTINPMLYALGNVRDTATTGIRDVDDGSNNGFNMVPGFEAVPGFDLASGWGTPDVATFIPAFLGMSPSPTPTATATPSPTATATATTAASATATATASATPTATPTAVPVTLKISPKSLKFSKTTVGTPSKPKTVKVSNPKGSSKHPGLPVSIDMISDSAMFTETNTCSASLAAGASCSITVTFTPSAASKQTGTLTITDNTNGGRQTVPLSGTGK